MVLKASTHSSRTFLLKFWFSPVFVDVFIVINPSVINDRLLCLMIDLIDVPTSQKILFEFR